MLTSTRCRELAASSRWSGANARPALAGRARAHARPSMRVYSQKRGPQRSFDGEDELDDSLAQELARLKPRDAYRAVAEHMDLVWRVSRSRGRRAECQCCHGDKEDECHWCHGTGMLMVGDTLFCSTEGKHSQCPICKGKGYVACSQCRGTGFTATWIEGGGPLGPSTASSS